MEKYASVEYSLLQHRFWFPAGNPPIIRISKEQVRETGLLIEEIQREFNAQAEGSDRIVRLLLQLILLKMNRFYLPGNVTRGFRREAELVRHFLVNLQQNLKVANSVSSHAALLGVSPETLSETVKKETGKRLGLSSESMFSWRQSVYYYIPP